MLIGYARKSPSEWPTVLDQQLRDLDAAGVNRVFSEEAPATMDSPVLSECLASLTKGDVLVVAGRRRLARNTRQLLVIEAYLTERGIGLVLLDKGLDTRTPEGKRKMKALHDVVAQQHGQMLHQQSLGLARARQAGKLKGRPPTIDRGLIFSMNDRGLTGYQIAKELGIRRSSVYGILSKRKASAA